MGASPWQVDGDRGSLSSHYQNAYIRNKLSALKLIRTSPSHNGLWRPTLLHCIFFSVNKDTRWQDDSPGEKPKVNYFCQNDIFQSVMKLPRGFAPSNSCKRDKTNHMKPIKAVVYILLLSWSILLCYIIVYYHSNWCVNILFGLI